MVHFPVSIESYLREAAFTQTEIVILRYCMGNESFTLRELAARTGKSTGVLNQAVRKLQGKGILCKDQVNGSPRYGLCSTDAILQYIEQDIAERNKMQRRKSKDFQRFLSTVEQQRSRPAMEYYEGIEGMKQAYEKFLDCSGEWLQYLPVRRKEEEDPLREFRSALREKRQQQQSHLRTIAVNTPLARRYRERDHFEYRQTALMQPDRFPLSFEKVIVGDIVGCFDHQDQKACLITFDHFAESERRLFFVLFNEALAEEAIQSVSQAQKQARPQSVAPTKVASGRKKSAERRFSLILSRTFGFSGRAKSCPVIRS